MEGIKLTASGLEDGAKQAHKDGMTFDEYCEMLSKVVISGQTAGQIKKLLTLYTIDMIFDK